MRRTATACLFLLAISLTGGLMQSAQAQPPATPAAAVPATVLPPQNAVEECAERLVAQLSETLTRKGVIGALTRAEEKSVTVNLGASAGILPGATFEIFAVADGKETRVGTVRVTKAEPESVVCEVVKLETGQTFATGQKAVRTVRALSVGIAGGYGPIAQHACVLGVYLTNDLSDRLAGRPPFTRVMTRNSMATWISPRSESENQTAPDLGMDDLQKPDAVKKVASAAGVDALLYCHLERIEGKPEIRVTARLVDGADGTLIAVARETLPVNDVVTSLLPGTLLYDEKFAEQDAVRVHLTGSWKTATFSDTTMLIPGGPNTNVLLVNRNFVTDYTVQLTHNGEHQAAWQETLVLQWKDSGNWVGVRFSGDYANIMGMTDGATWTASSERLDVSDKGGRGYVQLEAKVIGKQVLIQANGKTQIHVVKQTFPGYVGLACLGNTDTQATIPSVWRVSKLRVVRAGR